MEVEEKKCEGGKQNRGEASGRKGWLGREERLLKVGEKDAEGRKEICRTWEEDYTGRESCAVTGRESRCLGEGRKESCW